MSQNIVMKQKGAYEAPRMVKVGDFETVTQAAVRGRRLDATFSVDTPIDEVTLS